MMKLKDELEELEREWDRLDSMGGQEEKQRVLAERMLDIKIELNKLKIEQDLKIKNPWGMP